MSDELDTFVNGTTGTTDANPELTGAAVEGLTPKKAKAKKEPKEPKAAKEPKAEKPAKEPKVPKEKPVKEPKPIKDNIGRVNGMNSIAGVRKALQIAIAKKAKAVGNAVAIARYETEIAAARTRLDTLIGSAKTVKDFIDLGEDHNRIITMFIIQQESVFEAWCKAGGYKTTKRLMKTINDELPDAFFKELPIELHDALLTRHQKTDYRLRATCSNGNLMALVAEGALKYADGKWFDKTGALVGGSAIGTTGTAPATAEENVPTPEQA